MKRLSKDLIFSAKLLISLGMIAVLFFRWTDLWSVMKGMHTFIQEGLGLLVLAILLIAVNWSIEAFKWMVLLRKIYRPSFFQTIRYVLTGVTVGFITPGRSGEFAGRMLLMPEGVRLQSLPLSFLGGIAQVIPLVVASILLVFYSTFNPLGQQVDALLLAITLFTFLTVYFGINQLLKWPWVNRLFKKINILPQHLPNVQNKIWILILATFRFLIFMVQYLLVLAIVGLSPADCLAPVIWMLLLQSLSPALSVLDFGVRGSIAYWVFSQYGLYQTEVLSAVFLIWFFNLCLPALMGYYFILRWKNKS